MQEFDNAIAGTSAHRACQCLAWQIRLLVLLISTHAPTTDLCLEQMSYILSLSMPMLPKPMSPMASLLVQLLILTSRTTIQLTTIQQSPLPQSSLCPTQTAAAHVPDIDYCRPQHINSLAEYNEV